MAIPGAVPQYGTKPRRSNLLRIIAMVVLGLIVLVGLAVLIIWLSIRPRRLKYTIESGSIHNYNLSHDHLNATFDFQLRAHNPNRKVSIYYDRVEAIMSYDDETVAMSTIQPFYQPHRNVTDLGLSFVAKDVQLFPGVAKNLRKEKASGEVELEIRVKAKLRFKVGIWKWRHRTLKLFCSPVVVYSSSSKNFERVVCDVDL